MRPLGAEWRLQTGNLNPAFQKYIWGQIPQGFGIIYAFVKKFGDEKAYIGQCKSKSFRFRIGQHKTRNNCRAFSNAISKYGFESFEPIILDYLPVRCLDSAEVEYIDFFKTLVPNGYNINEGGRGAGLSYESNEKMKATQRQPGHREAQKRRCQDQWDNPEKAQKFRDNQSSGWKRVNIAKVEKLRSQALPHEPVLSKRVPGQLYFTPNDKVARCNRKGALLVVCPGVQDGSKG